MGNPSSLPGRKNYKRKLAINDLMKYLFYRTKNFLSIWYKLALILQVIFKSFFQGIKHFIELLSSLKGVKGVKNLFNHP